MKRMVFGLAAVMLAVPALAAENPVIESIDGATSVSVATPQGQRQMQEGDEVAPGDRVRTSGSSSARILYDDGSQLLVGRGTTVEVQNNDGATQWNKLYTGHVHAIVAKPKAVPPPGSRPRFVIRTKTAVLGVRGTEFAVDADEAAGSSEIHTLDGVVEVAKDDGSLLSGKGYAVKRDQFIQSRLGGALRAPRAFDRAKYLTQLRKQHPGLDALRRKLPRPREQLKKLRMRSAAAREALRRKGQKRAQSAAPAGHGAASEAARRASGAGQALRQAAQRPAARLPERPRLRFPRFGR